MVIMVVAIVVLVFTDGAVVVARVMVRWGWR